MDQIVIYKSKKKGLIVMVSSILIMFFGCLLLRYTCKDVIGWSLIILSVFTLIFGIGTFLDRKPQIILTSHGITEIPHIGEEIEWDKILRVDDFFYRGQYFIWLLVDRNYKSNLLLPTWFYRFSQIYTKEGIKAILFV